MPSSANVTSSDARPTPVAVVRRPGADAIALLVEAVELASLWEILASRCAALGKQPGDLAIAIKPDLDIFVPGAPTGTDPVLVEAFIALLRERGYERGTVCDGRNRSDNWLHNRDALYVPDLIGYTFEAPPGVPYDVAWRDDAPTAIPLNQHDPGGALRVNGAWGGADVRISFAKAKTDDEWGYSLSVANLLGLVSGDGDATAWPAADRALHLARRIPPDFAIIDAVQAADGLADSRDRRAFAADTVIASPSALLADWVAALKMGLDPEVSPLNRLCLSEVGLPEVWDVIGDTAPWSGWSNPSPNLLAATAGRARWPELDDLARALLQPVDRERFPFRDVVVDQLNATLRAQLSRISDLRMRDTVIGILASGLGMLGSARFAFTTNIAKGEMRQSLAPPTLDLDGIDRREYEAVARIVETQRRVLDGMPEDARGFRFRTIGGHTHFAASRIVALPYDDFVERVNISASIRYMNDYLGGAWFVIERDAEGRPTCQAERNFYLPQPNWIAAAGGEPIDVEKIERVAYEPDRRTIWWRTVKSPNESAESDDGMVSFLRTPAGQVEVRIFARQRFTLPPTVAALGVERWSGMHRELVSDAYGRFFDGTMANLLAAYEGRSFRIGRPPRSADEREVSELRAVLSGAFATIGKTLGWAPAGGVIAGAPAGLVVEPVFVDEQGFSHFIGQPVAAVVTAAGSMAGRSDDPLTPATFLLELGRAFGRDLAAVGLPQLDGVVGTLANRFQGGGTDSDPGATWAAAHLGVDPFDDRDP